MFSRKSAIAPRSSKKPSLRQRAALARDAAGRFIKRQQMVEREIPPIEPQPAEADELDPALAVAIVFRTSWNALGKVLNAEVPDELSQPLSDAQHAAYEELRAVRPTTAAGYRALAECWSIMLKGERGDEEGITLADDAADSLIAAAGACVPVQTPPEDEDPVHALIREHRTAYAEWDRLSIVWNDMEVDAPGYREAVAASTEPGRREVAAYEALFAARPKTFAAAAALGSYLSEAIRKTSTHTQLTDGERALKTITTALRSLAPAAVAGSHPDAALFALGTEFMAAWVAEGASDADDAEYRACNRVAQQIVRTPAATAAGLGIKALLLARLDSEDSSPHRPISAQGPLASHWNVLRQVQEGAAQLAAGLETVIPMTDGTPAVSSLVTLLDLASATMDELRTIRELADHVGSAAYAHAWRGCCHRRDNPVCASDYNDAGKLMHWLGDALTDVETAVDNEVARRIPGNCSDREVRLSMRAMPIIDDGDPDAIEAFARELLDHAAAEREGR